MMSNIKYLDLYYAAYGSNMNLEEMKKRCPDAKHEGTGTIEGYELLFCGEAGRAYFRQFGMEDRVQEFTVSSATVDLAAKALGVEGARIAKTLSFKTADGCMLILAAGDARIDNHKFKEKFHMKAKMLSADEVLELVGHPVGGVCPFGCKEGIPVYLDVSLQRFETVFPAVGSPSSAIELNLDELYKYSNALEWIDVCKLPAPAEA